MNGRPELYDQRTRRARAFRHLIADFTNDLGGADKLSHAEKALVRNAAAAVLRAEELQAAFLRGENIDDQSLVRLINVAARLLDQLKIKNRKRQTTYKPAWRQG